MQQRSGAVPCHAESSDNRGSIALAATKADRAYTNRALLTCESTIVESIWKLRFESRWRGVELARGGHGRRAASSCTTTLPQRSRPVWPMSYYSGH
jgi:hypothetical protein